MKAYYLEGSQGSYDCYTEWIFNNTVYLKYELVLFEVDRLKEFLERHKKIIPIGGVDYRFLTYEGAEELREIDSEFTGATEDIEYTIREVNLKD